MSETASHGTPPRPRGLLRVDARIRLVTVVVAVLLVAASSRPWLPLFALATGWATARLLRQRWGRRMAVPVAACVLWVLAHALLTGEDVIWQGTVGPLSLRVSSDGMARGGVLALRMLASVQLLTLLAATTPASELFAALRWLGLPHLWIEQLALTGRYGRWLTAKAQHGMQAQRVRLGYAGVGRGVRSMGLLSGSLLLGALEASQSVHLCARARGFCGAHVRPATPSPLAGRQWGALAGAVAVLATVWLALERGGLR